MASEVNMGTRVEPEFAGCLWSGHLSSISSAVEAWHSVA